MNQKTASFAKALFKSNIPIEAVDNARTLLLDQALFRILKSPAIKRSEKHAVIDAIFHDKIKNYMKVLSDYESIPEFPEIYKIYQDEVLKSNLILHVFLTYVIRPEEKELLAIKEAICRKYNKKDVLFDMKENSSLIGGFILTVGDTVFDRSIQGSLNRLYKVLTRR